MLSRPEAGVTRAGTLAGIAVQRAAARDLPLRRQAVSSAPASIGCLDHLRGQLLRCGRMESTYALCGAIWRWTIGAPVHSELVRAALKSYLGGAQCVYEGAGAARLGP